MRILLDRDSSQPMYLQIQDRLQALIQSGSLLPGERLPSIRTLAKTLQVNKLTVIEAYERLLAQGLSTPARDPGPQPTEWL
ncbi:MAG: GntR family transcriptional regulator [Thermostichus sp. DG02_5_bins_236]